MEVKIKRCQAIRSHAPGKDGWLEFDMGDIVLVPKPNETNVWQGVCKGVPAFVSALDWQWARRRRRRLHLNLYHAHLCLFPL
jgi:hypothetical protein